MITWILQTEFVLNFFLKVILICHCHSEIFEISHIFKRHISCFFIMIKFSITVITREYLSSFLCVYVYIRLLKNASSLELEHTSLFMLNFMLFSFVITM